MRESLRGATTGPSSAQPTAPPRPRQTRATGLSTPRAEACRSIGRPPGVAARQPPGTHRASVSALFRSRARRNRAAVARHGRRRADRRARSPEGWRQPQHGGKRRRSRTMRSGPGRRRASEWHQPHRGARAPRAGSAPAGRRECPPPPSRDAPRPILQPGCAAAAPTASTPALHRSPMTDPRARPSPASRRARRPPRRDMSCRCPARPRPGTGDRARRAPAPRPHRVERPPARVRRATRRGASRCCVRDCRLPPMRPPARVYSEPHPGSKGRMIHSFC